MLNRGKALCIDGSPPINYGPANNALLMAAGRIADFYMLLGNEAYADALDPTIGFGTGGGVYGTLAPSIFAFQNQLDSLLEEELALLRGRDDAAAPRRRRPVYNRLFWNFTTRRRARSAYAQTYNITDQNRRRRPSTRTTPRILYPQGHGDAWGHYLTAITTYYDLLRHPNYTWVPRAESVLVAGAPVQVDYLDERKFAKAAAAKARDRRGDRQPDLPHELRRGPGRPVAGLQGHRPRPRLGPAEWARRAGQGAYFDWVVANAILPAEDPNPDHTGIQKIDRTTVRGTGRDRRRSSTTSRARWTRPTSA